MLIKTFLTVSISIWILACSHTVLALDLALPDRLQTPSKHFSDIKKTAFLDLVQINQRLIAAGDRGVIGFSDDGGLTWTQSEVPVSTLISSLDVVNHAELWAVGHSGVILQSIDNAKTWRLMLEGNQVNQLLVSSAQLSLKELTLAYEQADEEEKEDLEYEVEDAEFALSNAEFDVGLGPSNPFLDVLFLDEKRGFAVGAYGFFVSTVDGGASWQSVADRLENFDRYHLNTLTQLNGGAIIIAGEAGTLFASNDEGDYWETLYGPYQGSFFGIQALPGEGEALLYGLKGHVFKTQDAGQSWGQVQTGVETSLTTSAISPAGKVVVAGLSGVVLVSIDEGETFNAIKTAGFESFNAVEFVDETTLVLASDDGIQTINMP